MKTTRYLALTLLLFILFIMFCAITSCKKTNEDIPNIVNYNNEFVGAWISEPFRPLSNSDTTHIIHVSGSTYSITNFDYIVTNSISCTCDTINNIITIDSWDNQNHHVIGNGYLLNDTITITYSIDSTQWNNYTSKWYKL